MIRLRKLDDTDQRNLYIWRNAEAEAFGDTRLLSRDDQEDWYYGKYLTNPGDHMYVVMADNYSVGTIGLIVPTREIQRVLLGNQDYKRKGIMSQAVTLLLKLYGPGDYHLYVKQSNQKAIDFYRKNGFAQTEDLKPRPGMIIMSRELSYQEWLM